MPTVQVETRRTADPRVVRSENAIEQALLAELAADRGLASVTVSEVAEAAGVTRKTFYTRFGSLEQVVRSLATKVFMDTATRIGDDLLRLPLPGPPLSRLIFRAYEEHQAVLAPLVRCCPAGLFLEPVSEVAATILDRIVELNDLPELDGADRDYLTAAVASVTYGVLSVWVQRGFAESPEAVARFTDRLLAGGIERVLLKADREDGV